MIIFASRSIKLLIGWHRRQIKIRKFLLNLLSLQAPTIALYFLPLTENAYLYLSIPLKCFGNCPSVAEPPISWFWSSFLLWFLNLWWMWCNQNSVQSLWSFTHQQLLLPSSCLPLSSHSTLLSSSFSTSCSKRLPITQLKMIQKMVLGQWLALLKLTDIPA